jgi:hypothetical protein
VNVADQRTVFERVADLMNRQDWDAFPTVFHADYVEEYPQSGEVIRGLANAVAVRKNYPGGTGGVDTASARVPGTDERWAMTSMFTIVRLESGSDTATAVYRVRYPDGSIWWLTALWELRGDKIAHGTMMFAPSFDPPDWREPYRESNREPIQS